MGDLVISWIALARANYIPGRIICSYRDVEIPLVYEFAQMRHELDRSIEERKLAGAIDLPHDGSLYKLLSLDYGRRELVDDEEVPVLILNFGPTSYFDQIVTDLNIGNPVRERYASAYNVTEKPVKEFSSILGVNLNLITEDNYLIVAERSKRVHVGSGKLAASVGEQLQRPIDADDRGRPDPFFCARRGANEELGLTLAYEDIEFTAFGVHPVRCHYSLIGWCRLKETVGEVDTFRVIRIPKDKWESSNLHFIPHNPEDVARFVYENLDHWDEIGLASVVLSLYQVGDYSHARIERAFSGSSFHVTTIGQ